MGTRLPPLEALRYFECAARHLNFTAAAKELCVSQSAVSQKIILLEAHLQYKVFDRKPRQLHLTENGEELFKSVHQALNQIRDTVNHIESHKQVRQLEVYSMPAFASRWLMPCIHEFYDAHPNIDLNLAANFAEPIYRNEEVDIGICHGKCDQTDMQQELLFRDYIYPVASPELLKKITLNTPEDLNKTTLLHDSLPNAKFGTSWSRWLSELNIEGISCNSGYSFNQVDLIVQAALNGQGVALGRHALVAKEIENGRLVPLFGHSVEDGGIYVMYLKKLADRPQVSDFISWIKGQSVTFEQQFNVNKLLHRSR
ncbi:transcriptional regulator GcvA [Psychromonas sp. 14N.309.X.WAT.B.A12]|uniref:transcriptional regulator GcvA n=1 Tax=Psychromonas sp. 14N.309.X.WAT.B.A12 TaxID=2998322 RepID=UPI0025AFFDA2|nr:transcriptional regulator GcvA [Psychromonas sp. 14N.309.X.WAT.B.A12]MDN2664842.1 transcriptional regulator GcvA [Psychromonas sp. 14N.309.X.WAT.B.A12]